MKSNGTILILIAAAILLAVSRAPAAETLVSFTPYTNSDVINDSAYYRLESVAASGPGDFHDSVSVTSLELPTATSVPTTSYPPLPTATSIPTMPYPSLPTATSSPEPTATSSPEPTSAPTSTPAATFTQTPTDLPPSTPATAEISSPTSTTAATKIATVTPSPAPPSDGTSASGSAELTVEASVEPLRTPSPTSPPPSTSLPPTATFQPPMITATATATALSLPSSTPKPAATPVALLISRDPAGLGHLWLVGILLIALGAGAAWLAYSFIRRGG